MRMRAKRASEFPVFRRNMNTITFLSKLFEMYVTLGRVMGVGGVRVWGVCGSCVVGWGTGGVLGCLWGVCGGCVGAWGALVGRSREIVSLAALLSGYLGKSGHLPRYKIL